MNDSEAARIYGELFSGKDPGQYRFSVTYSGRFSAFNANIKKQGRNIMFGLSKEWKEVGPDIKKGLFQTLLSRLFKQKKETPEMRLYHIFIKNAHIAAPKTETDDELKKSFEWVNLEFFGGMIDCPNLRYGKPATSTMGSYNYHSDTITINPLLKGKEQVLTDYIMYHELLHKKLSFTQKNGRSRHHTKEFRILEKSFPDSQRIEKELSRIAKNSRIPGIFRFL